MDSRAIRPQGVAPDGCRPTHPAWTPSIPFSPASVRRSGALNERLLAEPAESEAGDLPDPWECPRCGCVRIVRNGSIRGRRKFRRRGFGRTFSARAGTVRCQSHKNDDARATSVRLAPEGLTLPKIVKGKDVLPWTASAWRHRLLHAMRGMQGPMPSEVVEADEAHFRFSFKGRRRGMPRRRRRRGRKAKTPGMSAEQAYVLTATDRRRGWRPLSACIGRMSVDDLRRLPVDSVDRDGSMPVTGGRRACAKLAEEWNTPGESDGRAEARLPCTYGRSTAATAASTNGWRGSGARRRSASVTVRSGFGAARPTCFRRQSPGTAAQASRTGGGS